MVVFRWQRRMAFMMGSFHVADEAQKSNGCRVSRFAVASLGHSPTIEDKQIYQMGISKEISHFGFHW